MGVTTSVECAGKNSSVGTVVPGAVLYQAQITPSSRKVRMFLAEMNLCVKMVDVTEGFGLSRAYFDRYPHGTVPMLELEDGTQIGEAMAICRYFDESYPQANSLFGQNPKDRAIVDMWERRAYLEGMAAVEEIFRNSHPLMMDRGLPGTTERIPQIPDLVERGHGRLRRWLEKLDERLNEKEFIAGKQFSVADITTACALDFGEAVGIHISDNYKNVLHWRSKTSHRRSASA